MNNKSEYVFIEPLAVTKSQALKMLGSAQILKRMIEARWVVLIRKGAPGRSALIDMESLKKAYRRWKIGEQVPLSPAENAKTIFLRS